jgi:hypothetical protein
MFPTLSSGYLLTQDHAISYPYKGNYLNGVSTRKEDYMSEQVKTLWLLECREGKLGRLFTFYASNEQEADTLAKEELLLHPELSRVALSERPDGFTFYRFRRPGCIICQEV